MTAKATQSLSAFSLDFQDLRVREVRVDGKQRRASPRWTPRPT